MLANSDCPNCLRRVEDWHFEWYKTEMPLFYKSLAAMDCPLCGEPVGYQGGTIGPAPMGVPLLRRHADKAAKWSVDQAGYAGGTLAGYVSTPGPGLHYAGYWTAHEISQADRNERARRQGPKHDDPESG